ncbi:hypothetical protein EQV77_00950 [Halobacillus fulvus]|nr:hypothetical protein EQV77_00950 [Halobacillus fulvus]
MERLFSIVNDQGYEIDTAMLETESKDGMLQVIPENYVPPNQKRLFRPKWNFDLEDWEEGESEEVVLSQLRKSKFRELSAECTKAILGKFTSEVDGKVYEFSFDTEAQANFDSALLILTQGMEQEAEWTAYTLNGEVARIKLDKAKLIAVAKDGYRHKDSKIKRLRNELEPMVMNATKEELEHIQW